MLRTLVLSTFAMCLAAPTLAQTPPMSDDPGPPLSGYPRNALRAPTPAELKTATYVRDVVYGHHDGMALTYDVFKPVRNANGALVVNMVSAGWRSSWGAPEERQARYQALIDKGFTVVALYHASAPRFEASGRGGGRAAGDAAHQAARPRLWRGPGADRRVGRERRGPPGAGGRRDRR